MHMHLQCNAHASRLPAYRYLEDGSTSGYLTSILYVMIGLGQKASNTPSVSVVYQVNVA